MSIIPLCPEAPLSPSRYLAQLDEIRIRVLLAVEDPSLRGRIEAALDPDEHVILDVVHVVHAEPASRLEDVVANASRCQAAEPDVLVALLRTPEDLEAISALRRAGWRAPILLVSLRGPDELCIKAFYRGADIVLTEPLDAEELRISLRALAPHRG
jgi:DNA-binding NarL/FixJ family response regulator